MIPEIPDHLHLGCGLTTPPGWLNVDGSLQVVLARRLWLKNLMVATDLRSRKQAEIPWRASVVRLNLTRRLPFPEKRFVAVYSSHVLEHLYHDPALSLLRECHRVLRLGAVCRAVVPDLESLVGRDLQANGAADPNAGTQMMEELLVHDKSPKRGLLGAYYRMTAFHQNKWMCDAASLEQMFTAAVFSSVRRADYRDSRIERIGDAEDSGRILGGQGVAVEGLKD